MIRVELIMADLSTISIFHVIEAKTSSKLLLRRSWLHERGIVVSTLHECLKYYQGGERKVDCNVKVESHFADVRFLKEDDAPKETMPSPLLLRAKVARKKSFKHQKKTRPNNSSRKKKANRETHPRLLGKWIKRLLSPQGQHP